MRRPLLDLSAQLLPVLSQLIERIFLTGLLVQRLGVGQFERWSLITATVALLSMVDLGTQITFSNRMSRAAHRGDVDTAVAIFRQSNMIFALLGAIVLGATLLFASVGPLQYWLGLNPPLDQSERVVALSLGGSMAIKLTMTNASGVYRAMMAFGRGTMIVTGADLLRIFAGIAALILTRSMEALAIVMTLATLLAFVIIIPMDLARRFTRFRWRLSWPTSLTTHRTLRESLLFATGFLPSIVLTQIPVMMIGSRAASGVLASYVLLRTLSNVIRTLSQKVTFIAAMELSRLETQARHIELDASYRRLAALIAVTSGIACALVWSWGALLLHWWIGSATLFDPVLLAVMLAPLVLVPGTQLNFPLLTYGHRPESFATAVIAQSVVATLLALLLPVQSIALRLTLALSLAEILVFAPIIAVAARRMIGNAVSAVAVPNLALALSAAAATAALSYAVHAVSAGIAGLLLALAATVIAGAPVMYFLVRRLLRVKDLAYG
ncbi:MAG: hypothetical protein ABIR77_02105 [Sphingomicrobium sp.]